MTDVVDPNVTPDPVVEASAPAAEPRFIDSLPEDLKAAPALQNFKDAASLAKSYVEAQSMIGNSVRIPSADASVEAKKAFFDKLSTVDGVVKMPDPNNQAEVDAFLNKLGRPETPDNYKADVAEDVPLDPVQLNQFKGMAHKLGLTNAQYSALVKYEADRTAAQINAMNQSRAAAESVLKETWGNDFNSRLAAAKEVRDHFGAKYGDAVKELFQGPAGNNPVLAMMAAELGKAYKESGIITGTRPLNFGMTPDEAKAQIGDIQSNSAHAYHNDRDPGHRAAVDKMAKLYQAAYPETPSN